MQRRARIDRLVYVALACLSISVVLYIGWRSFQCTNRNATPVISIFSIACVSNTAVIFP